MAEIIKEEKGKKGRPEGINFEVFKGIKISEEQEEKWSLDTPKQIRDLIDEKFIDTEILKKMIPVFIKNKIALILTKKEIERVKELYGRK